VVAGCSLRALASPQAFQETESTMESPVLNDVSDGVLHLTLNRPAKLNPFTYEMIGLLLEQLERADHDPAIRAILIDGAGGNFSSGDDIKSMGEHPRRIPAGAHATREFQQRLLKRWYWFPKPTIAAVRGRCHGIASDMMLAADFRIVSRTAAYGDIRARRAIPVGTGGTWLLPRMVGLPAASQMMLTGDVIDGEEMYRLGLAMAVVEDTELDARAWAFATRMASGPTKAIGLMKQELRHNLHATFEEALEYEMALHDTPVVDRAEGRLSFIEKRDPVYQGE